MKHHSLLGIAVAVALSLSACNKRGSSSRTASDEARPEPVDSTVLDESGETPEQPEGDYPQGSGAESD